MSKRIIYQNENGGVSIIVPMAECPLPIEVIAAKDVPRGVPYKIIDASEIPQDRTFRDAWEADISQPDGKGAYYGAGGDWEVVGIEEKKMVLRNAQTGKERRVSL